MSRRSGPLDVEVARFLNRCIRDGACLMGPQRGYGSVRYGGSSSISAHRAVYIVRKGPIAEGLLVRHTCDRPGCVEPDHLLLGTVAQNSQDMVERRRGRIGVRHPAVVTPPTVAEAAIRRYLRGGVSQATVAAEIGVSQATFGRWVRGEQRRDINAPTLRQGKGYHALQRT